MVCPGIRKTLLDDAVVLLLACCSSSSASSENIPFFVGGNSVFLVRKLSIDD